METASPDREPAGQPGSADPAAARTSAWWRQPATTIPMVISLAAAIAACASVVVSCAAYADQHQADRQQSAASAAAAAGARETEAKLVSCYPQPGNPKIIILRNLSRQPLYQATLVGSLRVLLPGGRAITIISAAWLGQIEGCTSTSVNLQYLPFFRSSVDSGTDLTVIESYLAGHALRRGVLATIMSAPWKWRTNALDFTDGNDVPWVLTTSKGQPHLVSLPYAYPDPVLGGPVPTPRSRAAAGCS